MRRSIARFREALERDADHTDARTWLIQYLWSAPRIVGGDRKDALKLLSELAQRDPAQAHRIRGGMRWDEQAYAEAEREYRALVGLVEEDAQGWYMIGRTRQLQGDWSGAAAAYDRAITVDSAHARATYYAARAAVETSQNLVRGEMLIRRFLANAETLEPGWAAPAHATLGRLLEALGRTEEAVEAYNAALSFDRGHKEAAERLKVLGGGP